MKNNKVNSSLNYVIDNQFNAFEDFKNETNNKLKNLAPQNTNLGYNQKKLPRS